MTDRNEDRELYELLGAVCNETINPQQHTRLQELLEADADARRTYFEYLDLHLGLTHLHGADATEDAPQPIYSDFGNAKTLRTRGIAIAVTLLACMSAVVVLLVGDSEPPANGPSLADQNQPRAIATVTQMAATRFASGSTRIRRGSELQVAEEYVLTEGILEIRFRIGAEAIIEAPAVFEIAGGDRMLVKYGKCSVHAPEGAEGFVVDTPLSKVVDLGTRFAMNVDESGETDVHVIEGATDVHAKAVSGAVSPATHLVAGTARRFSVEGDVVSREIPFNQQRLTRRLPDRVVDYETTQRTGGGAEELRAVTVQRGGRAYTYAVDDLIGIEVAHFKATLSSSGMTTVSADTDPAEDGNSQTLRTGLLDADWNLNTGLINPGGSEVSLTSDPVINDPENADARNTPGLAIRFKQPIVNDLGPDVVLFDLHVIVHPDAGDPFHVSPLRFRPGLKSHTISEFDIRLSSPEAQKLAGFHLFRFDEAATSLSHLEQLGHNGGVYHVVGAKALAVGIDLSDLGYEPGERVEGLFIQDTENDMNYIDPVFIGGLPQLEK